MTAESTSIRRAGVLLRLGVWSSWLVLAVIAVEPIRMWVRARGVDAGVAPAFGLSNLAAIVGAVWHILATETRSLPRRVLLAAVVAVFTIFGTTVYLASTVRGSRGARVPAPSDGAA
jgi:hypothetical protein